MSTFKVTIGSDTAVVNSYFHSIPRYDADKKDHYWVLLFAYNIDPNEQYVLLTTESLISVQPPFCYYCNKELNKDTVKELCNGRGGLEKI